MTPAAAVALSGAAPGHLRSACCWWSARKKAPAEEEEHVWGGREAKKRSLAGAEAKPAGGLRLAGTLVRWSGAKGQSLRATPTNAPHTVGEAGGKEKGLSLREAQTYASEAARLQQ